MYLSVDTGVVSTFPLLWIIVLWTWVYKYLSPCFAYAFDEKNFFKFYFIFFKFFFFFLMWTIFKAFIEVVTIWLLFYGYKACGILAPRPGIEPTPPALESKSSPLDRQGSPLSFNSFTFFTLSFKVWGVCFLFCFVFYISWNNTFWVHHACYSGLPASGSCCPETRMRRLFTPSPGSRPTLPKAK